jgi:gliding motility-associated-like protein
MRLNPSNKLAISIFLAYLSLLPFFATAQGAKNAIQLDGINDYVEFSNNNRGITNQITVEAWIKTNSMGHHHIVSKYDRDSENGFQLLIQNGKACLAGRDGSGSYRLSGYSTTIVADNNWHHIAGVVHEGTWIIYVDGIMQNRLETGYANSVLNSNENLLLGNYYYEYLGNHFYAGQIDEVRLWKRALTEDEIRQNMCRTLPADIPDLIAYYKLDNIAGGIIVDHSSLKRNGRLVQTTPAVAAITSGAPIGDKSFYRYTTIWDAPLEMVTDIANFSVSNVDPLIEGFHIYTILSTPASTTGIGSPEQVSEYYGVFKIGDTSKKYKVNYEQAAQTCGGNLYRRADNAVTSWNQVADTTASPIVLYTSSANYGEFAATSKAAPSVKINGPSTVCAGSTATLRASYQGTGEILWSTGETSSEITITKGGQYWVEVTSAGGCTTREELEVSFTEEPVLALPSEVFTCHGEPVMLNAIAAGASYSWSNGQTTPSISATTPGIYTVAITIKDCRFVREVVVSNDECPTVPNIITPNGDGKNDAFVVVGVEKNTMELKILNRWGKAVYTSASYDNDWQATDIPAGIYYYQLTSSRTQKIYKGWLEVMK